MAVEEDGFRVGMKKSRLFPFEDLEGVRLERDRGTLDPTWTRLAEESLSKGGGVSGIFTRFQNTYSTPQSRTALAQLLREKFSAGGSDSTSFKKMPGKSNVKGQLHPSMISFDPASWDLFCVRVGLQAGGGRHSL